MSDRYDAIIIGAGIIGGAIGLELARKGFRTLNVDKLPAAGYGSTSNTCAIIRFHYSTAEGVVTFAGRQRGYGIVVKIRHAFGFETVYAHLSKSRVKVGQRVERGQRIADMGSTGRSTGSHLHYEVRIDGVPVNPSKFIGAARDVL